MTEAQSVLLLLLSKSLFGKSIDLPEIDWDLVLKEADAQAIVPIVYSAIDKKLFTPEQSAHWRDKSFSYLTNNIRVIHNHEMVHEWMSEAKIPYVILKGCASASYYPIPSDRSMGDVDFLVPTTMLEKAGEVLESKGLKPWDEEHISHIVYKNQNMHLEMHFNVAGTPNGKAGDLVRGYFEDIFEIAVPSPVNTGEIMIPSPFHHGLVLLLHTCHHMTGEGVGLRHLCDWAVFANSFSNDEFISIFEEKLKKIGLWKFAQILTAITIKYLGADDKAWVQVDNEIVDEIMEDILSGGNFGRKDSNRNIQTYLISDRGKNGVGNTRMISQVILSANSIVRHHWPAAKNNLLLLPAGWIYFGVRRAFRELIGTRRKTDIAKVVKDASKRRDIYSEMHLFEEE